MIYKFKFYSPIDGTPFDSCENIKTTFKVCSTSNRANIVLKIPEGSSCVFCDTNTKQKDLGTHNFNECQNFETSIGIKNEGNAIEHITVIGIAKDGEDQGLVDYFYIKINPSPDHFEHLDIDRPIAVLNEDQMRSI